MDITGIIWAVILYMMATYLILFTNKVNLFKANIDNRTAKFLGIRYRKVNENIIKTYDTITTGVAGLKIAILASKILYWPIH